MNGETPETIDFWFDFASTYSYLSIMRIEAVAGAVGVPFRWRPLLLGPIFGAQGMTTSPFNHYPIKGKFMFRDMERRTAAYGLPFARPLEFPVNSVTAARLAVAALETPQGPPFCRAVSKAHWGEGRDIADQHVLIDCSIAVGLDPKALLERSGAPDVKPRLRQNTEEAQALGVFGAPAFTVGSGETVELFWGDDQLEDALAWAKTAAMAPRMQAPSV
ncbi:MAG: 2-hydroxychromene-2-carboxylate isomerase [Pseudomonadota bacterium]